MASKAAAKDEGTAVVETKPYEISADFLAEMEADSGSGLNMGLDDVGVPYLYVLQTNSPQVNEDHDNYIKGARAGMFYNNLTGEVFDGRETGLEVIPCGYERKLVEWVDRDSGGGYVADHTVDSGILEETTPDARGRPVLKNGNLIVETAYHYVFMKNPNSGLWEEIIIPMKSTFLKKSRRWNKTLVSTVIPGTVKQAPRWLYVYKLMTVKESKDTNTWSNFDITRTDQVVTPEQYRMAKAFAELQAAGRVVKAKETDVADLGGSGGGAGAGSNKPGDLDDDIPF